MRLILRVLLESGPDSGFSSAKPASQRYTDVRATKPMQSIKSNLGLLMAGSYGLVTVVVLCLGFLTPHSLPLYFTAVLLTLPWSIVVVILGFLLIHLSTYGMDYGFMVGAVLNALSLFLLGRKRAKAKERSRSSIRRWLPRRSFYYGFRGSSRR
jgi:hypothetical protein